MTTESQRSSTESGLRRQNTNNTAKATDQVKIAMTNVTLV